MRARKNRAFFIETLIITFLLLLMLTILVRIFGAAALKSQIAARRTDAAQIAQNIITMFDNSEGDIGQTQRDLIDTANDEFNMDEIPQTTLTFSCNENGEPDPEGSYDAIFLITCEVRAVGYMLTGNLTVVRKDDPSMILAQLDTAKYFPDSAEDVLNSDEDIMFDEIAGIEVEIETEIETESEAPIQDSTETEVAS